MVHIRNHGPISKFFFHKRQTPLQTLYTALNYAKITRISNSGMCPKKGL